MNDPPLTGRTVAVPEARELPERWGARVLRCSLVGPVPLTAALGEALRG